MEDDGGTAKIQAETAKHADPARAADRTAADGAADEQRTASIGAGAAANQRRATARSARRRSVPHSYRPRQELAGGRCKAGTAEARKYNNVRL